MRIRTFPICVLLAWLVIICDAKVLKDIEYAVTDAQVLMLDLYLPDMEDDAPLIVWVHGGAWRAGSKDSVPIKAMMQMGWAIASVEYRLSPISKFPAAIHDIKAAIRYLRAHSNAYPIQADKIAIAGSSAGGHLAALVGVSNQHPVLEGNVGKYSDVSSDVQAIVSFFGASNLTSILGQSTPHGLSVRVPALELFLGDHPEQLPEIAKLASPVFHVDSEDPPLLLLHGDQDPQMPINQSHELMGAYLEEGLAVEMDVVYGAAHGGKAFYEKDRLMRVDSFLREALGIENQAGN